MTSYRLFLIVVPALIAVASGCSASGNGSMGTLDQPPALEDEEPTDEEIAASDLDYIASDFKSAGIVAHVDMLEASTVDTMGGYAKRKITCRVIESFKGDLAPNAQVEFFIVTDIDCPITLWQGQWVVFLVSGKTEDSDSESLYALENSPIKPTERAIRKLRSLR